MIKLDNVTLFCISSDNISGALYALQKSMEGISFGSVKLITHEDPGDLPEDIEFSQCYNIQSIHDYNYYCIYNLTKHITTDYCLLVQPDGYVIRPWKWNDDWFNYDYIGAPWRWEARSFVTPFGEHIAVGNGGFSLRDKKLMSELCTNKVINSEVEDLFYTEQIRKHYPELMPSINECNDFAIESIGNKLKAKGIHGTDKYYRTFKGYKEIFEILELSN